MTTADEIRAWTANQIATRRAYYGDLPDTPQNRARLRAKAARKAEAQRAYRLRKKEGR